MRIFRKVTKYLPSFFVVVTMVMVPSVFAANQFPGQILDLSNWKQTLPVGENEKPTEIKADKLFSFAENPFFQLNEAGDGVQFRAPVNGVTTSGSGYPRSELREMTNRGKEDASWSTTSGYHAMTIEQAITAVPKNKKHVVAGQIHDDNNDVIVIRLEQPRLFIDINGKQGPVLDANYELGKKFTVKFLAGDGKISVYYNESETPSYTMANNSAGNYFKAGVYTQSNCSKESTCDANNFGEVIIYKLKVEHSDNKKELKIAEKTNKSPKIINENRKKQGDDENNQDAREGYFSEIRAFFKKFFQKK